MFILAFLREGMCNAWVMVVPSIFFIVVVFFVSCSGDNERNEVMDVRVS